MIGRRNQTTWESSWNHKETMVVRIPVVLAPKIIEYARAIDQEKCDDDLEKFIKFKRKQIGGKRLNRTTPIWRIFNEFELWKTSDR